MKFTDIEFQTNQKIYNINRAICKVNAYLKSYALTHPGEKGCRKLTVSEEIKLHDYFVNSDGSLNEELLQNIESYEDLVKSIYDVWQKNINEYHIPNDENRKRVLMPTVNFEKIQDNYYAVTKDFDGSALNKDDDLEFDVSNKSDISVNGKVDTNLYSFKDGKPEFISDSHRILKVNSGYSDDKSPYYLIQNIDIFGKDSYGNYWCDYDGFDQETGQIDVGYDSDETVSFGQLKSNVDLMLFLRHTGAYNLKVCMHDEYMWNSYCRYISNNLRDEVYDMRDFIKNNGGYKSISNSNYVSNLGNLMHKYMIVNTESVSMSHLANVDDFMSDSADYDQTYLEDMSKFAGYVRHCNNVSVAAFDEFHKEPVDLLTSFDANSGEIRVRYYRSNGKPSHSYFMLNSITEPFKDAGECLVANTDMRPILETHDSVKNSTSTKVFPDSNIARAFVHSYMGDKVELITSSKDKRFVSGYVDADNRKVEQSGMDFVTHVQIGNVVKPVKTMSGFGSATGGRYVTENEKGIPTVSVRPLFSEVDTDNFEYGARTFVGAYSDNNDITQVYFQGTQRSLSDVRHRRSAYIYKSDRNVAGFEKYSNEERFLYSYNRLRRSINYAKDLLFCRTFDIFEDIDYSAENITGTSFNEIKINDQRYKSDADIRNANFDETIDDPMVLKMHQMLQDLYTVGQNDDLKEDIRHYLINMSNKNISDKTKQGFDKRYPKIREAVRLYNDISDEEEFDLDDFILTLSDAKDEEVRVKLDMFYEKFTPYIYIQNFYRESYSKKPNSFYNDILEAVDLYNDLYSNDANKGSLRSELVDDNNEFIFESFIVDLARTADSTERIKKLETFYNDILVPYYVGYVPENMIAREYVRVEQTDADGNVLYDDNGTPLYIQDTDKNGKLKFTKNNEPIYKTEPKYIFNTDVTYDYDDNGQNSKTFDVTVNSAVLNDFANGAVDHRKWKAIQPYGNIEILVDDVQILRTVGSTDILTYNDVNVKSVYVATDQKDIDSGVVVDNKIDFSKFNEKIVVFDESTAKPMIGDDNSFVDEMGKYIKEVLLSKGRAVEDQDLLIDEHGIVRYKYDSIIFNNRKYDNLSAEDNAKYHDFSYGYIGQIFVPNPDGTICTNYNAVSTVGNSNDNNKTVVLNPGYSASIMMGDGAVEPRMIFKGYTQLLKDQIQYILNENCTVIENKGQLNNTALNGVYRHLYSSRTPMDYDFYDKLRTIIEDAALRSKDAEIAGLGYEDVHDFYMDLRHGKINYQEFVDSIDTSKISQVTYALSNGEYITNPEFNRETIVTKAYLIQFLQTVYRLPNIVREEGGLFAITGATDSVAVYDRFDNYYSKLHGVNPALYPERDASYLDPTFSNTAYVQGLNGALPKGADVGDDSYIIPSSEDFDMSIIFDLPIFKNFRFDGPDRTNMSIQNIIADGMILPPVGFAQITCGGLTMDDGYVISKELADANPVIVHDPLTGEIMRDDEGNPILRPLAIGDKIDAHGNKGTIAAIIDRTADINTIEDEDVKWITLFMKFNKNVDVIGAPYPEISRLTTATIREAFEAYANSDSLEKFDALTFDFDKMSNDPDFVDGLVNKWDQIVNATGDIVGSVDDLDGAEVVKGLISYMSFILTDKNVDAKMHIYSEEHDGSKGRTASGQLSFGLKSLKCDKLLKAFYASNRNGYDKVNAFLELYGMAIDDEGKFTNDISINVKDDSKVLSMMPTDEALMRSYGFVKQTLDHTEIKINRDIDDDTSKQLTEYINATVKEFYSTHSDVLNFNKEFLDYLQTDTKDAENKSRLYRYCTNGTVSINPVIKNNELDSAAFNEFKSNMNQAVVEFYKSSYAKNVQYYDFEQQFLKYLGHRANPKYSTGNDFQMYKSLQDRYIRCKNIMDLEMINLKAHFGDYDYMEIPFDHEFASGAHLAEGENGGYLCPILAKKYRSNVKDSDGNYIPDQFTNHYYDIIRGVMSYKFWSMLDIDTGTMPLNKSPYLKNTFASMSVHESHIGLALNQIEANAEAKFEGKRNLMKSALFGNQIKNAGTIVITAKPSLKLNEVAMSFDNAKSLGVVPDMSDLVDRLGNNGVQSIIDGVSDSKVKQLFQQKFNDYTAYAKNPKGYKHRRRSFLLSKDEFKALPEKERMCLVWRDPLLQNCGLGGFSVVIDDRLTAAAINPAIDTRFDADFDGDTIAVIGFFNRKKLSERQLYRDAYNDLQNNLAINHTLLNESLTDYAEFEDYFKDLSDDTPTFEVYEKLSDLSILDNCHFNINTDLDVAVGSAYAKSKNPELYAEIQKQLDFAKIDALRCHFTENKEKSQEFAERANDVLSDNIHKLLKTSIGKFYMRNNTPQNHINDLVREVIHGYKGNFTKLKDVLKFTAYKFESDVPEDMTDYKFIKDYIDAAKDYAKDKSPENEQRWKETKAHYKEVLKTATINSYDFVKDYVEHPDDSKAKIRFDEMLKHFVSISFATNIKTMGTGVAGKYLQRGIMLSRKFGPEAMAAAMRVTYGATQGILQAKHDPEEAVNKFNMIRYFLPALYKGQHLTWDVVDGVEVWHVDENNDEPLTRKEFVESYMKVCESATGLKFDCHRCNIEVLADCIYESKDDDAVPQKNIYDAFKTDNYGTQVASENFNSRIQGQVEDFSALDMIMYVEKPAKLFECIGMQVFGGDMDWLKPVDERFNKNKSDYTNICGLVAYNHQMFSADELEQLNSGKPIVRKFESKNRSNSNRNMKVLQKISKDQIAEAKGEKTDGTILFYRKDTDGNMTKHVGTLIATDKKTGDVLISWDDNDVSDELNKVSLKLRDENPNYRGSYDAIFANAKISSEGSNVGKVTCTLNYRDDLNLKDDVRKALEQSVTSVVSDFYKTNPEVQDFKTEFTEYLNDQNSKDYKNRQKLLGYMEKGMFTVTASCVNDQELSDNVNFGVRFCGKKDKNTLQMPEVYFITREKDGSQSRNFEMTIKKGSVKKYGERNDFMMSEDHSHKYREDELAGVFRGTVKFDKMSDALKNRMCTGTAYATNVDGTLKHVNSYKFVKDERFGILPEFIRDMYVQQFDAFEELCKSGQFDIVKESEKSKPEITNIQQKSTKKQLSSDTKSRTMESAANAFRVCENMNTDSEKESEPESVNTGSPLIENGKDE